MAGSAISPRYKDIAGHIIPDPIPEQNLDQYSHITDVVQMLKIQQDAIGNAENSSTFFRPTYSEGSCRDTC